MPYPPPPLNLGFGPRFLSVGGRWGCRFLPAPTRFWKERKVSIINSLQKTVNPFKPEFTVVNFIHYKPQIAAAILDL